MAGYTVERSTTVDAPAHHVHALVDDFHHWLLWSPWEDVDPDLRRTYTGPGSGVGAHYAWAGNRKAGAGEMEITASTFETITVRLDFFKPFKSLGNEQRFTFSPAGEGTRVDWRMTGQHTGLMSVFGRFMSMDKMIGSDFEKGLARLKAVAEDSGA